MVKASPSNAGSAGSIPSQETKIPHASWPKKKKQNTKNRSNIVTNSIDFKNGLHEKSLKKEKEKKPRGGRKTRIKRQIQQEGTWVNLWLIHVDVW